MGGALFLFDGIPSFFFFLIFYFIFSDAGCHPNCAFRVCWDRTRVPQSLVLFVVAFLLLTLSHLNAVIKIRYSPTCFCCLLYHSDYHDVVLFRSSITRSYYSTQLTHPSIAFFSCDSVLAVHVFFFNLKFLFSLPVFLAHDVILVKIKTSLC